MRGATLLGAAATLSSVGSDAAGKGLLWALMGYGVFRLCGAADRRWWLGAMLTGLVAGGVELAASYRSGAVADPAMLVARAVLALVFAVGGFAALRLLLGRIGVRSKGPRITPPRAV